MKRCTCPFDCTVCPHVELVNLQGSIFICMNIFCKNSPHAHQDQKASFLAQYIVLGSAVSNFFRPYCWTNLQKSSTEQRLWEIIIITQPQWNIDQILHHDTERAQLRLKHHNIFHPNQVWTYSKHKCSNTDKTTHFVERLRFDVPDTGSLNSREIV